MRSLCVIPARGGSKRIPHKNIKNFCGLPLIAHSIKTALNAEIFDDIIVSTDDENIALVAREFGAKTPFIREANLSDDYATTSAVIKDAIKKTGAKFDIVCCLYATAPLLKPEILREASEKFRSSDCEFLFAACEFPFPVQRAIKLDENGAVNMFYPEHLKTRSQDLEPAFHDAGQFYFGKKQAWLEDKAIFAPHSTAFVLPRHLVCDIDTLADFEFAQKLYEINNA